MAFAASTRLRRGLAVRVTRIRPRRNSAVMNMVPTTSTAISPANVPTSGVRHGAAAAAVAAGQVRGDVTGPGHGERAAGLAVPAAWRLVRPR